MKKFNFSAKDILHKIKTQWKTPAEGRYMPIKEIAALSIGGMGVKFICYAVSQMILGVGNTLIGNTIGIPPQPLYIIYVISVLASLPLTTLRANMIDNSKSAKGRFRPYIFTMAVPTVILAVAFTWMPYDKMTLLGKCITVLLFNIGFQFFYMFVYDSYTNIVNVLSPNTYERSDVYSITNVTDSFAPTIIGFIIPILAKVITGENTIYDMKIYRVLFPPILLLGLLMTILIHLYTEEKIVQPKEHVVKVYLLDALRAVSRNKYFWVISLASWLGFLETSFLTILAWTYNYQNACTPVQYSIITAVYGNSALWPMLLAPILVRKIGKRNLLLYSNLMSVAFILMMYPVIKFSPSNSMIWLLLIFMFINGVVTHLGTLLQFSVNGDIRDYQQYITGERIDGMFLAVGFIGSVVNMVTGFVLPTIYNKAGLNETVATALGFSPDNVYDVLYDPVYFRKICGVLILASSVGALLNALPFFFYDLSESKQKGMIAVLKIRAMVEDYSSGLLDDDRLKEGVELVEESRIYSKMAAEKPKRKLGKEAYKQQKQTNEKIAMSVFVMKELEKFSMPYMQKQVERARSIVECGLENLDSFPQMSIKEAKAMPKTNEEEKEERKLEIFNARVAKRSKKARQKYFADGIVEFDKSIFNMLFKKRDELESIRRVFVKLIKEGGDKAKIEEELKIIQAGKKRVEKQLKQSAKAQSEFNRAAEIYLEAKKLLAQLESYTNYEKIHKLYVEKFSAAAE